MTDRRFSRYIKERSLRLYAHGNEKIGFGKMFAKEKSHLFYHEKVKAGEKNPQSGEKYAPGHIVSRGISRDSPS